MKRTLSLIALLGLIVATVTGCTPAENNDVPSTDNVETNTAPVTP